MGNRAVITSPEKKVGIYLHWSGSPEQVESFLAVCRERNYRDPVEDECYALGRLCGVCHEQIPGGLSLGIGALDELDCDNGDNGTYVVGKGWQVIERLYVGD